VRLPACVSLAIPLITGTYTYANGDEYTGDWKDDKRHGVCVCVCVCADMHVC